MENPNTLISAEQLAINIEEFKEQWKGKAAAFMNSVQSQIHRFCAAYTHQHLLLFQTGNSASESANASIDAFFNENKPHTQLVQTLLQYDAEQNNRERRDLMKMRLQLPNTLKETAHPHVRQCLAEFSDKITEKFQDQLAESQNYTAKFIEGDSGYFIVQRNEHLDSSPRKVVWDPVSSLFVCVCLTRMSSACHCRHIICVAESVGHSFDGKYIHNRFRRRFNLPTAEEIVSEFCFLRSKEGSPQTQPGKELDQVEFEYDGHSMDDISDLSVLAVSKKKRRTKLELNYQSFMDEARKLGEFVQTSSELTELATKSIQLLHIDLRSGRTPDLSKFEERVGPMFEIMDPMPSEIDSLSSTIVQTSSYRRMPGQPKRSRILASSETRKKKSNKPNSATFHPCKVCSGDLCTGRFCRTLALHGNIVKPDRDHGYAQFLSIDIPITSSIEQFDYTSDPFPMTWDFVVVENLYRDHKAPLEITAEKVHFHRCKMCVFVQKCGTYLPKTCLFRVKILTGGSLKVQAP